ncbi:MAG TPA: MerC domain-containing protein [Mucilaginibacter sp.]|nr:MerC domain-containing protein [Mucilaginibacter sp.]
MNQIKHSSRLDSVGMTASILCAIHCAIVPLLITSLPLVGLSFLANPWFEWSMIGIAVIVGFSAIGFSYFRSHHRVLPAILLLGGFLFIIVGHLYVKSWREMLIVPFGGLLIALAHFFNYKYTAVCRADNTLFHLKHPHPHKH